MGDHVLTSQVFQNREDLRMTRGDFDRYLSQALAERDREIERLKDLAAQATTGRDSYAKNAHALADQREELQDLLRASQAREREAVERAEKAERQEGVEFPLPMPGLECLWHEGEEVATLRSASAIIRWGRRGWELRAAFHAEAMELRASLQAAKSQHESAEIEICALKSEMAAIEDTTLQMKAERDAAIQRAEKAEAKTKEIHALWVQTAHESIAYEERMHGMESALAAARKALEKIANYSHRSVGELKYIARAALERINGE